VSPRYLLDTNTISEPIRPHPNQGVVERLRTYQDELAIASPVWHELLFGCYRLPPSRRRESIERYLTEVVRPALPILPYDALAAEWHATERVRLVGLGKTPPFVDGQIAAIARTNDLTLVTANVADFVNFSDLRIENWRS
jgi:tRNA(fMet)-specific endonuclease VapC